MRRAGFLTLEVLAGVGLLLALTLLLAVATGQYAGARRESELRRLLRLSAAAQLERVRAGLEPLADRNAQPSPDVSVSTTVTPGAGEWAGLFRIEVVARREQPPGRIVEIVLVGYVDSVERRP